MKMVPFSALRPVQIPPMRMGRLGQSAQPLVTPTIPLIESAELSAAVDFTAAAASGFLAYSLYKVKNPWGLLWATVAVGSGMKFLHDLSKF